MAIDRALMCLIGSIHTPGVYEADTDKWEHKRIFRNEVDDLWVCECTNES